MDDGLNDLRELADAGVEVLGDTRTLFEHHCSPGNWLFIGALLVALPVRFFHINIWLLLAIAFAFGWIANNYEERQIKARLARQAT